MRTFLQKRPYPKRFFYNLTFNSKSEEAILTILKKMGHPFTLTLKPDLLFHAEFFADTFVDLPEENINFTYALYDEELEEYLKIEEICCTRIQMNNFFSEN